jgi:EIN3-binding F-box protein
LADGCPNLQVINVMECYEVTDIGIIQLAEKCPNIQKLISCYDITNMSLIKLGEGCHKLMKLDLSDISNINGMGIRSLLDGCRNLNKLRGCDRCKYIKISN